MNIFVSALQEHWPGRGPRRAQPGDQGLSDAAALPPLMDVVCPQCTGGGILRGSGNQKVGAIFNAIGYYVIGLPIGISLMFATRLGVMGKLAPGAGRAVPRGPERLSEPVGIH